MNSFTFFNPTKIIFGKNQICALKQEINPTDKVLLAYGGGSIKTNGVYEKITQTLSEYKVFEFSGIEANPTYETLLKAVELVRKEGINFIIAAGGGSVIDGVKFIAAAARYPSELDPWIILTGGPKPLDAIPFGTILTLPATGSEMNSGSVITKKATKDKMFFTSPLVFPKFSILDPTVTFSLPSQQIANGIADSFIHVLEQYLTYPVNAEIQDRFAESILLTLLKEGPLTLQNPHDFNSRANFMWAATLALNGLIGAGVPQDWTTHMIGHELTVLHGIDHGRTLAIIMPATLKILTHKKREKLLQYAERVWNLKSGSEDERISKAIECTELFFQSLNIDTRLNKYGITTSDIDPILKNLERHGMINLGETGEVTLQISRKILEAATPL